MNQELRTKAPTIQQQIDFVRATRHMVYDNKRDVVINHEHHGLLTAIEETLLAAKLMETTGGQARPIPEPSCVGTNDPDFGKTNVYVCSESHRTVTIDRAEGVTPFLIKCPSCEEKGIDTEASSCMYRVSQALVATHEFYKPTEQEMKTFQADCAPQVYESIAEHVSKGGLLFRKIQEVSNG